MIFEPASDSSSIAAEGSLVRIRTPEGLEIRITQDRALEWMSPDFQIGLEDAVLDTTADVTIKEQRDDR